MSEHDQAWRSHRMESVVEADVLLSEAVKLLKRASLVLETSFPGVGETRAVKALHERARVAAGKVTSMRNRTPSP